MHDEVPAALPLISFAVALAAAPLLVSPAATAAGLLFTAALALRWPRLASALACAALGVFVGWRAEERRVAEGEVFRSLPAARFTLVEADIELDWSRRPHVQALRTSRFRANGLRFDSPLAIYTRFTPPRIAREKVIRVEGFLRFDERGRYTMSVKSPHLLSYHGRVSPFSPATWNRLIAQRLEPYAASHPREIAMIEALALGRGERLSEETREDYRRGGTYHLLVFSGLQIGLAAGVIALLLRWTGYARSSDWCLLGFAVIAPLFIGPTASVSRAGTGIALYALSRIARRPTSFENLWCVAAMLRLVIEPRDLTDPAFHLTYAGAGALIFIGKPLARLRMRWLAYAIAAELAVAPLTLFHFQQFALGGSLATVALTPVVFVQLLVGAAFAAIPAAILLDAVRLLSATSALVNRMAAPASGFFASPPLAVISASFAFIIVIIAFTRGRVRVIGILLALAVTDLSAVLRHRSAASVDSPRATFLDVGQGDAILLRSGRHAALVDGGGRNDDTRFGHTVLLPMLVNRGIRRLDLVVLSHAHPDHCGGLPAVLRELHVGELVISTRGFRGDCARRLLEAAGESGTRVTSLRRIERRQAGEIALTIFPPARRYRRAAENNGSVIVRAEARGRSLLLTGDIEREAELDLASSTRPADILKLAHHGSRTSTSPVLLDAVRPRLAVISCGRSNLFGHPHRITVESLDRRGIRIWRTDLNSTIDVALDRVIAVTPQIDTLSRPAYSE
ncbi:MAG TPA: DNA internalization-related competence protein ComEC/Rec2 [Thermoanaerobaculia bacterium]|nr:DNA internalization-related competence protein ComEC/Rec2 [Thermoanaerobaculia bacterium]